MQKCKQCATCCKNGGPALHSEDLPLVGSTISLDQLLCVRLGEMSMNPLKGKAEPANFEFIKVAGKPGSWECLFLDEYLLCALHPDKPLECRVLECWQPQAVIDLMGRDLLNRSHLLAADSPLFELIHHHDEICSYSSFNLYFLEKRSQDDELDSLIADDLNIRAQAAQSYGLSLAQEMLYFGRPFFKTLQGAGWQVWEEAGVLRMRR